MRINKTVDVTDVNVTDYITYTIDIVNKGPSNATDVVVWDKLSDLLEFTSFESSRAGITYDPVTGKVTVGYLNVNETVVLIIVAKVFSNGTIPNKANITSYENDTNSSNNNDTSDNVTSHAIVDLRINKTVNVTDVNVTDVLPSGMTFMDASNRVEYNVDNRILANGTGLVTSDQVYELINNADYKFTTLDGVGGVVLTSKNDSSKSIFFPAAGGALNGSVIKSGEGVAIWLNRLISNDSGLCFYADTSGNTKGDLPRYNGLPIRGVING